MRSVVAGDKVEKVGFGRFDDREKRFKARVRNGSGWKRSNAVGVVGIVAISEVGAGEVPVEVRNSVDHRWVRFQAHAAGESIQENGSDQGALMRRSGFFFDNRGQRDDFTLRKR